MNGARLEFVEPDNNNRISVLELIFESTELERTRKLIGALWQHVQALNFPDVSQYDTSLNGIKQFEQDLIDNKI